MKARTSKLSCTITIQDLIGEPLPAPRFKDAEMMAADNSTTATSTSSATSVENAQGASPNQLISAADVASFKALNVEVSLNSRTLGSLKIVPGTPDPAAKELSAEQTAYLLNLCNSWPGAVIEEIRWPNSTQSDASFSNDIVVNNSDQ